MATKFTSSRIGYLFLFLLLAGCKKEFIEKKETAVQNSNQSKSSTDSRPNIILFIADDFGIELPHFSGGRSYQTPNLDYLSAHGKYFSQAYSHPDGFPSRLALLSGKYNFRNYIFWGKYPSDEKSIGNVMEDAGYKTCYVGKWQNSGGDTGIKRMGFQDYRVFLPYISDNQRINRYKDPILYEQGNYLPADSTAGKYSEDMFYDYLSNFIDSAKSEAKPFFAVYAFNLVAAPYVPSPDHPDYATWNPANDKDLQDTSYFASMVSYLDKIIGKTIQKANSAGIANNTLILFCGDNATHEDIISNFRGNAFRGTKTTTTKLGTLTPLLAYWPGIIAEDQKDPTLIDYTDFLPTLAEAAQQTDLSSYGILDGTSFFDNLKGTPGVDRKWVFCDWDNNKNDLVKPVRYTNNALYKLYASKPETKNFFNIYLDPFERHPLQDSDLTAGEIKIKNQFKQVLTGLQ